MMARKIVYRIARGFSENPKTEKKSILSKVKNVFGIEEELEDITQQYSPNIEAKISMLNSLKKERWEEIHKKAKEYIIFKSSEHTQRGYAVFKKRFHLLFILGGTASGGSLIWCALGAISPWIPALSVANCFIAFLIYSYVDNLYRGEYVHEIKYNTEQRLFCFTFIGKKGLLEDEWLAPYQIGSVKLVGKDQDWLYYNRATGRKYSTIGRGDWHNEELFLYSLMQANREINYQQKYRMNL